MAAANIGEFIYDYSFETFQRDTKTRSAVLQQLAVIIEAAARLPVEIRGAYRHIDWPSMIGLRNRVIHEYFGVDWRIVWDTATVDILELMVQVRAILKGLETPGS